MRVSAILLFATTSVQAKKPDNYGRIMEHQNDFIAFDVNSDNYVDAYEIRLKYPDISNQDISAFFIQADVNQDGLITSDEYINASLEQDKQNGLI